MKTQIYIIDYGILLNKKLDKNLDLIVGAKIALS